MPKQDDEVFEFDPNSFWKKLPEYERIDYIPAVNQNLEEVVLVPVSELETQSEEQVLVDAKKFYLQYNFIKKNLEPEKIGETVQWLRDDSKFLNLVARQLAFHFIKLYEHIIKVELKKTHGKLDFKLPPFKPILDDEGKLASIELNLEDTKIGSVARNGSCHVVW